MNKERLNYIIPILQAMADGKTILGRSGEGYAFININEDKFFMISDIVNFWELKIKPQPEVIYVNKWNEEREFISTHKSKSKALEAARNSGLEYIYIAKPFTDNGN